MEETESLSPTQEHEMKFKDLLGLGSRWRMDFT